MPRTSLSILFLLALVSCEKNISFKPHDTDPAVVVEAFIENNRIPEVWLSRSMSYFNHLSPEQLQASFIRNAVVTISNGSKTHQLKEYGRQSSYGYTFYYYSIDSTHLASAFKGELGKSYTLNIQVDGKEYTAGTTIPQLTKKIDSLWWKDAPNNPDVSKVVLMARITDPPGLGNYVRYYVQINRSPFYPAFNSVFDDQIVDGKTYDVQLESGVNRSTDIDLDESGFFYRGDSITVKFANIDKTTFDFWRTMEYNYSSLGNPFSSPTKVLSNLTGGALGYFGGYAAQFKTLVIPE